MIATLDNFGIEQPQSDAQPVAPAPQPEHSVPLEAARPIYHNFTLVRQMIAEAFAKSERTVLLLTSNGGDEKSATEWYLRRVIR
ncbi:MAG: hypothetical protein Q8R70_04920 [Methanoregula sp.]|nr:hypothetical protein [Methanoregula sp.]